MTGAQILISPDLASTRPGATASQLLLLLSALPSAVSCAPIGCAVAVTKATMPNTASTVRMAFFLLDVIVVLLKTSMAHSGSKIEVF
jgi:hypothetical protein